LQRPFFICKQFANKFLVEVRKSYTHLKISNFPDNN
jgi:hypothetical protein